MNTTKPQLKQAARRENMGLSLMTALAIQNNDVTCDAGGPADNGKYVGWIMFDEERWHPLLSTEATYPTAAEAKQAMLALVGNIKKADLSKQMAELSAIVDGKRKT